MVDLQMDDEKSNEKPEHFLMNEPLAKPLAFDGMTAKISNGKTDNKVGTNWEQTGNKLDTKWEQTEDDKTKNWQQSDIKTDNKLVTRKSLANLVGAQRDIIIFISQECRKKLSPITDPMTIEYIASSINRANGTVKTSIGRLIAKHCLTRIRYKNGRGGWSQYEIPLALYDDAIAFETDNKLVSKPITNAPSSSIYNKNTTTSLPEDWKRINFDLLLHIGFSETQLQQLNNRNMTSPEIVQDAINRFAYSLEHSDKVKAYPDPLNVLMGVLLKGQRWIESNYISPKDLALRQMFEERHKQKELQNAMIKELVDLEFPDWCKKLTKDEINTIVPADIRKLGMSAGIQSSLRTYFIENELMPRLPKDD